MKTHKHTHVYNYNDVTMSAMAFQITGVSIVWTTGHRSTGHRSYKTSKFRVTGLCERNLPVTSNAENVFISWHHHVIYVFYDVLVIVVWDNSIIRFHFYHNVPVEWVIQHIVLILYPESNTRSASHVIHAFNEAYMTHGQALCRHDWQSPRDRLRSPRRGLPC